MKDQFIRKAKFIRAIDGDTIQLEVDLGFNILTRQHFRIEGVNCPEIHSNDTKERERAEQARLFTNGLLSQALVISVQSSKPALGQEKYGRWLGQIVFTDASGVEGRDLARALIDAKLGVEYHGGKR